MITGGDTPSFGHKKLTPEPGNVRAGGYQILNASFTYRDAHGEPYPVLAEALPELDTDTWRLFANGAMDTTFRLRPNLTWHDGHPLTADDFVFAWSVYGNPALGQSNTGGLRYLEEVTAPDPHTVVIRWKQPYPDVVVADDLPPLPKHILKEPFEQLDPQGFINLSFWKSQYLGAGPYKLERSEPGQFMEASAFTGFALGRPKIDGLRLIYIGDVNTFVANLLSGEGHFGVQGNLYGEDGFTLESQWGTTGGTVYYEPISARAVLFQMRPEYAFPTQMATDVRVRHALAYLIDRVALNEAVNAGKGLIRDMYANPNSPDAATLLAAIPERYRLDARCAEQLLREAGFTRGADGWLTPSGERFTLAHQHLPSSNNAREGAIMIDGLRGFGVDATVAVFGAQRVAQDRATAPGIFATTHEDPTVLHSSRIASEATRWNGTNLGYSNPELDRLIDLYAGSLDKTERLRALVQIEQIAMRDLPALPMYWVPRVVGFVAGLKGVVKNLDSKAGIERRIWEWYWEA